ncbi:ABC transporter permease [Paenibacillus tritici]|uniref:ABC transporter permease n=1 Tax=Paenibacillus tritici TaxID=1873425 RepID=A0ABX2DQL3_9BACL|nr:ABC transporter permease [Paenibacillus tritici]NQX46720.1 ABC transporter permease [Paenibacillus tritici]QUL55410.1 ABC transporter permease [Paenibacillus tritici]
MMWRALSADWLKIRGKGIWFLAFLGPVGLIAMQGLNFGLRYDYLRAQYQADWWGGLIDNIIPFVPIALYLGGTLICSLIANVEHQTSSWKQLLALPISRTAVFMAKLLLCLLLLAVSCLLLSAGTVLLGLLLGFGDQPIPYADVLRIGFAAYAAAMPVIALQLWLSLSYRNQTLPVSLGMTLSLVSMFAVYLTEWMPLSWPTLALSAERPWLFSGAGLLLGLLVLLPGALHFARKDVD